MNSEILNLRSFTGAELLSRAKFLCAEERRITLEFLHFLREIDRRKLYAERGYSSLFLFCTQELGLSDGSAYRRIESMRLLTEIPQVGLQLETGALNLTTLSAARGFFKKEKKSKRKQYTVAQKQEILDQLTNKSKKECERFFAQLSPDSVSIRQDQERFISENQIEVTLVIPTELKEKLDQVKALVSHKNPNPTWTELLEMMADQVLKKMDLSRDRVTSPEKCSEKQSTHSRYVPIRTKRHVWKRDQGKCIYKDPQTQRPCESRYFLQIDHRKPFAHGGSSQDENNLQLLCASHNQLKGVKN